ncbi:hypothetical protein O0I10_012180 [Lichtheimia ornata]|uniref:Uncharacterized protein n=1 Tax=Lichtheimia ornata TaxID=688661 RepID=A0AAD7XPU1_9FUNG|nr:uncharacterized protein O0I10_012180 [Lichtheimia ornata]KAJ8652219.1 hypothetical protein O0I10_012180 [Lichtheimia ornata]
MLGVHSLVSKRWLVWRFVSAQQHYYTIVFSGAILVDPISSNALLINTVEVYGRLNLVDAHHERCLNKRGAPAATTNPPTTSRYKGVWTISMKDEDGTKLNIATKTFNALATSSIRLDTKHAAELGPTTSKFDIDTKHGRDIQIFFNEENYIDATKIAFNQHAADISDTDILQPFRQIRSKFNEHSSYIPPRSSSSHCDFHRLQPQTIFTYCTFDTSSLQCDGKLASQVFANIAREVINKREKAMLHKSLITNIMGKCKPGGKVMSILNDISGLFTDGCTTVTILDNMSLCKFLKSLAHLLQPYISQANQTTGCSITALYSTKAVAGAH